MHDLIFAVAFVAMVATPAMVAAIGGRKEYDSGSQASSFGTSPPMNIRPAGPPVRPRSIQKIVVTADHRLITADGPTLPMHNARGMANR
jgi:hypothetical protein